MVRTLFSVCSRKDKIPKSLQKLTAWVMDSSRSIEESGPYDMDIVISYDNASIYDGHNLNIQNYAKNGILSDSTVLVLCHDDIEIISNHSMVDDYLQLVNKPKVGWIGVAGCTRYDDYGMKGAWWNARNTGETRGFVFQGNSNETMTGNPFGPSGQCIIMDGVFLAISYGNFKKLGFNKPEYLISPYDFYDIATTFNAHIQGFNNYVVPIIIRHDSPGQMRPEWFKAKEEFCRYNQQHLPVYLNYAKTTGLPI